MWEPRRLTTLWDSTDYNRYNLARKADNLTAICEPIVYKMWEPRRLTTLWDSTDYYRDNLARKADNLTAICEPIV
jgi:type II secretory pathway component PulF